MAQFCLTEEAWHRLEILHEKMRESPFILSIQDAALRNKQVVDFVKTWHQTGKEGSLGNCEFIHIIRFNTILQTAQAMVYFGFTIRDLRLSEPKVLAEKWLKKVEERREPDTSQISSRAREWYERNHRSLSP